LEERLRLRSWVRTALGVVREAMVIVVVVVMSEAHGVGDGVVVEDMGNSYCGELRGWFGGAATFGTLALCVR
jgi:hypothetical protein